MTAAADFNLPLIVLRQDPNRMDDWSEEAGQWRAVGQIRVAVSSERGGDRIQFTTRKQNWILSTDRLQDPMSGKTYHIDSISNFDHRRRYTDLFCVAE